MKRILGAIIALAFAASASALTPYSQVRQDYPQVDDAIAAAASSDLHGTFNRLSALYQRSGIDGASAGDGHSGLLPDNFERNLEATLLDLREDLLRPDLESLTPAQQAAILDAARYVAISRGLELWQGETPTDCSVISPCPPGSETTCTPCVDDDSDVMNALQAAVSGARRIYGIARGTLSPADQATLVSSSSLTVSNFAASIEGLCALTGVESIDYE